VNMTSEVASKAATVITDGPAEFVTRNWESYSATALESMVRMTGYLDAYNERNQF